MAAGLVPDVPDVPEAAVMPRCVTCRSRFVKCWPWAVRFRPGGFGYRIWIHRACTRVGPAVSGPSWWQLRRRWKAAQEQHRGWVDAILAGDQEIQQFEQARRPGAREKQS